MPAWIRLLLVSVPMEPASIPSCPPVISPRLFNVPIAPVPRIPSPFVETIRPSALLSRRVMSPFEDTPAPVPAWIRLLLVKLPMEPASIPSCPPVISPLLFNVPIAPVPRIPSPLVETIRPSDSLSRRVMSPFEDTPAPVPAWIRLLLVSVPMEPASIPSCPPVISPLLFNVPIAPSLRMPSPLVDTIMPPASLSSRVIAAAASAASLPPSIRPVLVLRRRVRVIFP